jgi:DMSO/TMAO reductase YedYZ molybdopterin-dependent catalytic subunit
MKTKSRWIQITRLFLLSLSLMIILTSCGTEAPKIQWRLAITGEVGDPLKLRYAELVRMTQTQLDDLVVKPALRTDEITGSWSGVPLEVIFEKAEVGEYSHLIAVSAEGEKRIVAKIHAEDAIVALKSGGEWIAEAEPDKGPIYLLTPGTLMNRWVTQLEEIQVVNDPAVCPYCNVILEE